MLKSKFKKFVAPINFVLILSFILFSGFGCKLQSSEVKQKMQPITLNFWSVYDDEEAYEEIIDTYQTIHPNIEINYRKFRYEEYEQQLLEAWAEDRGPDIFSIPASWMVEYKSKIEPLPEKITMAYVYEKKGTLQKEKVTELRTTPTITVRQLKEGFPDVVANNVVIDNKIHGLPLSIDTLIMYYNKDILKNAGIVNVPVSWTQFQEAVKKMTRVGSTASSSSKIIQAGTAMGTGNNIDRAFDIISLLMMQSNAIATNSAGPVFNIMGKDKTNPGYDAITFYTDFATPGKDVYSWSADMPNSLDAFIAGQVGMTFGYNFNLPTIKSKAPKLNLGIASVPQLNSDAPKNYANYWLQTVAKKSKHTNEAWDFVLYMSQSDMAKKYLAITKKPAATRTLIASQLENEDLHASAYQALTADNWYKGYDALGAESAFKTMANQFINAVDDDVKSDVINISLEKIRQTYTNPNPEKK